MCDSSVISRDMEIAIIGGGIAGSALGTALQSHGFKNVTIYERDDGFERRRAGYGLTMLQGIGALRKLGHGIFENVKALDTPSRSHYIFDSEGNIICFFGTVFYPQPTTPAPINKKKHNLHISRQNLRNILLQAYCSNEVNGSVFWGQTLVGLDRDSEFPNKLRLQFKNDAFSTTGSTTETRIADLVIACDGINSSVRKYKYSPEIDRPLNYLGILLVLGITQTEHFLGNARVFQTVDGSTRLFAMPFASHDKNSTQNIMWQLSYPLDESTARFLAGNREDLKEAVLERCRKWHKPVPELIESTQLDMIMGIAACDRDPSPPDGANFIGNIALLGDAAHPMSPFKGQGANQALLDAVGLAEALASSDSVESAIVRYEKEMLNRVRSKVMLSRERVMTFHQPDILDSAAYMCRSSNMTLLQTLKAKGINSGTGELMEGLIMDEMNALNNNSIAESVS